MPGDDISRIKTVTFLEAIRLRPEMYVGTPRSWLGEPKNLLSTLVGVFTDYFLTWGVRDFTVCETDTFFVIKSKQDWMNEENGRDAEYYFRDYQGGVMRGEIFLTAFYFPVFTTGISGDYGKRELFEDYCAREGVDDFEGYGRVLIISKDQQLPKDHGIVFERPVPGD